MIGALNLFLRLVIWFLLTADLSLPNIIIGVTVALIIPHNYTSLGTLKEWLQTLWEAIVAIPQAYFEAIEIIVRPHQKEVITMEKVKPRRSPGLIFLDVFLITLTPKTIVLRYHKEGWYEVHRIRRRKQKLNLTLFAMILALLIPIYEAGQDHDIWQKMLAFASIATKTSIMILVISVLRDDWMIGVVGVLILSVGNAALMLLAHVLKRVNEP